MKSFLLKIKDLVVEGFQGWDKIEFLKGRKRMLVTVIGAGVALAISDSETVALISGAITEIIFALVRYFFKDKKNPPEVIENGTQTMQNEDGKSESTP